MNELVSFICSVYTGGDVDNKTLLQRVDDTMLDMQEEQKKQVRTGRQLHT